METPEVTQPQPKSKSRRRWWIVGIIMVLVLAVGTSYWIYTQQNPIPADIRKQVTFPIYFPKNPPATLRLNREAFSASSNVLFYGYLYEADKPLIVSIQQYDDLKAIEQFKTGQELLTPVGRAYIVEGKERTSAVLLGAEQTLILANAPERIPVDTMEEFLKSLKRVD